MYLFIAQYPCRTLEWIKSFSNTENFINAHTCIFINRIVLKTIKTWLRKRADVISRILQADWSPRFGRCRVGGAPAPFRFETPNRWAAHLSAHYLHTDTHPTHTRTRAPVCVRSRLCACIHEQKFPFHLKHELQEGASASFKVEQRHWKEERAKGSCAWIDEILWGDLIASVFCVVWLLIADIAHVLCVISFMHLISVGISEGSLGPEGQIHSSFSFQPPRFSRPVPQRRRHSQGGTKTWSGLILWTFCTICCLLIIRLKDRYFIHHRGNFTVSSRIHESKK